jgi:hypothetical protein
MLGDNSSEAGISDPCHWSQDQAVFKGYVPDTELRHVPFRIEELYPPIVQHAIRK